VQSRCQRILERLRLRFSSSMAWGAAQVGYTARAIRRSLKLPAQQPEPLAHGPPPELELLDQIA
jgi:hypothetical protein